MNPAPHPPDAPPRKATLVCRTCGREAPVWNWSVTEQEAPSPRRVVACPDCGDVLVEQPRFAVPV